MKSALFAYHECVCGGQASRMALGQIGFFTDATTPIFVIVVILLRNANEAVLQALGLAWFFLNVAIFLALDERYRRRHGSDQ